MQYPKLINPYWSQRPLFRDLILCQPFLEGAGDGAEDLVRVNSKHTLESGATWSVNKAGPCMLFTGTDYVDTKKQAETYTGLNSITFAYWLSVTSTTGNNEKIMDQWISGDDAIALYRTADDVLVSDFKVDTTASFIWGDTNGAFNDTELHHVVVTSNSAGTELYLDGASIGTAGPVNAGSAFTGFSWNISIGTTGWKGKCSSATYWNRGLLPAEVYELYRLGPKLGLEDIPDEIILLGISSAVSNFNVAFALNSNQIL